MRVLAFGALGVMAVAVGSAVHSLGNGYTLAASLVMGGAGVGLAWRVLNQRQAAEAAAQADDPKAPVSAAATPPTTWPAKSCPSGAAMWTPLACMPSKA
ncbi:hypothetical protein [Ideonella paludis]|uniref:hypothetical protein n=1 Tax=Ideonella paludis TaxID=1233411 RepID=UPI003625F98B